MMNNMFSMFDPSCSLMSYTWFILMAPLILLKNSKLKMNNKNKMMFSSVVVFLEKEISQLMEKTSKMSTKTTMKMFLMVMVLNTMAMIPFNFTASAHMTISLPMSMTMWASIMIFGWTNNFKSMMIHLTPMGTPTNLMNFMVVIEMVSNMIRPITLSVRLAANMVAGHLLISLLSSFSMASKGKAVMSIIPMTTLTLLEMMVAIVQAYVIITLVTLYSNEA